MTPTEFRTRLRVLGITLRGFSDMTGMSPVTVSYWGSARHMRGIQEFPKWVDLLLTAWERHPQPAE